MIRDFQKPLPAVAVDADMLHQAMLNLLLNALQAMDSDGRLEICIKGLDQHVQIEIVDSGPGIDNAIIEKIWDPFFTNKEKGTGLGLGIVQNIIEAHNGEIRLENAVFGGARVLITLPLKQELN